MSFLWVQMLWLLLLVPVLVGLYILVQRRRKKYALRYSSLSLVKEAMGKGPGKRRHIPAILFLTALTVMLVALARPAATIMLPSTQGTVILTFDVSGSMRADDLKPSRLEAAKEAAKAFAAKQPSNVRLGVVAFSESASIVQAPTTDREPVLAAIDRLMPQRGTAIGRGVLTSLDAIFEEPGKKSGITPQDAFSAVPPKVITPVSPGSYSSAVIVLLSDGASNTGPPPLDIIDQAADRGVRVYTVGVGSAAGTVLKVQGFGIRVMLDEATLKAISARTGGSYFRAGTEDDLVTVYRDISSKLVFKTEKTELTFGFTAAAAALVLAAGLISLIWFNRIA